MRGLSNVIVSLIMLSIMIPVGGVILDRVSSVGDYFDFRSESLSSSLPKVSVYFFRNQSSTLVMIYNYGSDPVEIDMLVSYNGSVDDYRARIDPGDLVVVSTSLTPPIGVVANGEIVWGFGG